MKAASNYSACKAERQLLRSSLKRFPLVKVLGLPRSLLFSETLNNVEVFLQRCLLSVDI